MTKTEIFAYIKNVKFPYWELFLIDGYKPNRLRNYKCEDSEPDASNEAKLNASLNALEITLSSFRPTDKFRIILKNSETANGSGIYGPVEFTNTEMEVMPGAVYQQPPKQQNGLAGLTDINQLRALGYIPQSEMEARIAQANLEQEKKLWELEQRLKKDTLKQEQQAKIAELNKEIELARKAREDANDGINKFVEVLKLAAPPIIGKLFGIDISALSGTTPDQQREVEVKDAKYIEIEKLASDLYDSHASVSDVIRMHNELKARNYAIYTDETTAEE